MTLNETFITALLFILGVALFAFEEMEHNIHVFGTKTSPTITASSGRAISRYESRASINYARKET